MAQPILMLAGAVAASFATLKVVLVSSSEDNAVPDADGRGSKRPIALLASDGTACNNVERQLFEVDDKSIAKLQSAPALDLHRRAAMVKTNGVFCILK